MMKFPSLTENMMMTKIVKLGQCEGQDPTIDQLEVSLISDLTGDEIFD